MMIPIILCLLTMFSKTYAISMDYFNVTFDDSERSKTVDHYPHLRYLTCHNCERVYVPVCASDNRTYTNECHMNCMNSKRSYQDRVRVRRYGPCIMGSKKKK
ncbi:uncharacterized protein LOC142983276 [Anticarsia gemmatalis]|uniref:uncharacterized protein LOC142983276 n=1 Tax=Anticarsia gemmatalis TaxID=129554 RepID=UPI003F75DCA5